jgi:hypothetical protein
VVQQAREFGENDADVFGAFRDREACELFHCDRVGPVVRHRAHVVETIGVRHRTEVAGVLANLLVIAVKVTEHGFEFHDAFAVQRDDHPKNAMGGGMVWAHRNLQKIAVKLIVHRADLSAGRRGRGTEGM